MEGARKVNVWEKIELFFFSEKNHSKGTTSNLDFRPVNRYDGNRISNTEVGRENPKMINQLNIICENDKGIERLLLTLFPFAPEKGDIITNDGVRYEVQRREFHTNCGANDGSKGETTVVLNKLN